MTIGIKTYDVKNNMNDLLRDPDVTP